MNKVLKDMVYVNRPKYIVRKTISNTNEQPYNNKPLDQYNAIIPANIFQTWHTKNLPPNMFKAIQKIKTENPGFKYFLFDDNDCREFIKKHFSNDILNAYDNLIPGAYKADLWRYCILYKYGGIYLDIKYIPTNGFKFINFLESEHWPLDINKKDIYNALLVCKPGNEILLNIINQIVEHVKIKYYGHSFLSPTGPELLGRYFSEDIKKSFQTYHILNGTRDCDKYIVLNGKKVLAGYSGYTSERAAYSKTPHYNVLWNNRNIYR